MKKFTAFLILAVVLCAGAFSAKADTLESLTTIKLSGKVYLHPASGKTKSMTATVGNLLKALGITGQKAKNLQLYYDSDTDALVIAQKGIIVSGNSGTGTPIATVLSFGSPIGWQKATGSYYYSGPCTTLNANAAGSYTETIIFKSGKTIPDDVINFITWGSGTGGDVIFKGTIKGLVRDT